MKLTTTLKKIRACSPCTTGWRTLLKFVGEDFNADAEINLLTILQSNGAADMLWCLRATEQDSKRVASQLAIEFAELALPIFEKRMPNDKRPRKAIEAAKKYNNGEISIEELMEFRRAADAAAYAADAAYAAAAAADAADAADAAAADAAFAAAAADAAYAADAADAAADAAAYAATHAADAAYAAAYAADATHAADAAREEMRKKQTEIICMILEK